MTILILSLFLVGILVAASVYFGIKNSIARRGQVPQAASQGAEVTVSSPGGTLGWLTDVRFNNLVTPRIVSFLYVLFLIFIGLGAFWFWIRTMLLNQEEFFEIAILALWTAPLISFFALFVSLLVRLIFESIMVRFRIAEDLRKIRDK